MPNDKNDAANLIERHRDALRSAHLRRDHAAADLATATLEYLGGRPEPTTTAELKTRKLKRPNITSA